MRYQALRGGIVRGSLLRALPILTVVFALLACEDPGKKSAAAAEAHVRFLTEAAATDVAEVREGLPKGAKHLRELFAQASPEKPDPASAKEALQRARDKVQDLRVAKSTFFAVATKDGVVLRSNQEQDELVEKNVLDAFAGLKKALSEGYVESRGSMEAVAGVRGREDAQWVAAAPVEVDGEAVGLYVTGWSWSAYAYRLETSLRSHVLSETEEGGKVPLLYVYVIVGQAVYGAPVAPMVNAEAIAKKKPLQKTRGDEIWSTPLEIDRRKFGVAVQRVPELGEDVAIAVLRSET